MKLVSNNPINPKQTSILTMIELAQQLDDYLNSSALAIEPHQLNVCSILLSEVIDQAKLHIVNS